MEMFTIHTDAFKMTEDEFFKFCTGNRDLRIEKDSSQNIFIMSPTYSYTGVHNAEINRQLATWNHIYKLGYVFDSNAGFTLPNNAMRSPDAAWIKKERWEALSEKERDKFAHICPDFIIELKSKTDDLNYLKNKMQEWIDNGCRLAWLIDTEEQKTYLYSRVLGTEIKIIEGFNTTISGEEVLLRFELDLKELKSEI